MNEHQNTLRNTLAESLESVDAAGQKIGTALAARLMPLEEVGAVLAAAIGVVYNLGQEQEKEPAPRGPADALLAILETVATCQRIQERLAHLAALQVSAALQEAVNAALEPPLTFAARVKNMEADLNVLSATLAASLSDGYPDNPLRLP